jgi:pyrroloquinoline quinone (PQQ) biosynthesis protein C
MDLREFGYMKKEDYWTRIESLSLNDAELKKLLSKYLQTIDKYNSEYFEYNKKHSAANALGEDTIDSEERDKLLSALKQSLQNLYQTINSRIEKIIT